MANSWGDNPVSTAPQTNTWGDSPATTVGNEWGDPPAEPSPYSPEGIAKQRQDVVQSVAARRKMREEQDAEALVPKVFVGIRKPFSNEMLVQAQIPSELVAFGSEALKSSPSVAAGAAGASAAMPVSNRVANIVGRIPLPPAQIASRAIRVGGPLVAGGVAAMGTRFAQEEILPEILPEQAAQLYDITSEVAAQNPNSALAGQIAGALPFFRPGLPINTTGGARLAVPAITGAVGGGIEAANQFIEGDIDPQRLALATAGSALLNRETALGARIAPNMVLPNISGPAPTELSTVGRVMNEPRLPFPTDIVPAEFDAMRLARNEAAVGEIVRQAKQAEAAKISSTAGADLRARELAERMMGKPPSDQLAVLDQELRLQKDVLTPAEERAGLEMKQLLKQQIDQQKALEQAAKNQQKAQADQQKAVADAQKQIAEANKPPEIPESQKILAEPMAKPPVLANVATDIASHTEGSPFALQAKLNELAAPAKPPAPEPPVKAAGRAPVETDPVKIVADRAEYDRIQAEMKKEQPLSEKYNALWQQAEDVKNRHGGLVPEPPAQPKPAPIEPKPVNTLKRPELRAELIAAGITKTPKGIPIEDANAAQLMDAVGKIRRGQLERGAVNPSVLTATGGAVAGGATGYATAEDQQPGESDEAYRTRLLKRTTAGAAIGGGAAIASMSALSRGTRARTQIEGSAVAADKEAGRRPAVRLPETEPGQDVRNLAKRVIEDKQRTTKLRETLANSPEIIYDKFLLGELTERAQAASADELAQMRTSADRNEQAMATIELANRADAAGLDEQAAALYAEASTFFTRSAQLLGVAKAVRSPTGYVVALREELKAMDRALTPAQEVRVKEIARKSIAADQALARAERMAQEDFSVVNEAVYKSARQKAGEGKRILTNYMNQIVPQGWDDITVKVIQGNLLTPMSQVANIGGNVMFQPVHRGSMSTATLLDAVYSGLTGKPRAISQLNPFPTASEFAAFADGTRVAAKEMLTGPGDESYVKNEVMRGFHPLRAFFQSLSGVEWADKMGAKIGAEGLPVKPDGSVAIPDRLKKVVEATVGIAPEVFFRGLNLGDKGIRRVEEARILIEAARLRGLKGRELDKFIAFPDKATQKLLETEARKAIFAQENKGVTAINHILDSGLAKLLHLDQIPMANGAIKILGRLNVPFRQFPVNYVMTALNYAVPKLAFAKGAYYTWKGDRRNALINIGDGIMGLTMYAAADFLWKNGLISEPTDKDAKRRSIQYDNMGGGRINLSGLERKLAGGDPAWQQGDLTSSWEKAGVPAVVFSVHTQKEAKERKELQQTGVRPKPDTSLYGVISEQAKDFPGIAQFALDQSFAAGTAALLEAWKEGFTGPAADAWKANMFRAASTIAVPNTVEAIARAEYEYIPELKGDTLGETIKNIWDFKTFQLPKDERAILKRDIWGEPIKRTPENQNPYVYQFLDISKAKTQASDPFKQNLLRTFNESDNVNAYPALPAGTMTLKGVTAKLLPKDIEAVQELTGRLRRTEAEPMVTDPDFMAIPAQQRVLELEKVYARAASQAKRQMLEDEAFRMRYFAELFGGEPSDRVIRRDTKARNTLEQD